MNRIEKYNPVQTNEMPRGEKVKQRIWAVVQKLSFFCTLWFMHRLRIAFARLAGGGDLCKMRALSNM